MNSGDANASMISDMSAMLRRTRAFFFPPPVATLADLETFATGEASYLTQKTVLGYCRVKTLYDYDKLLTEPAFRDALEVCRWETYAGALADTLILVEGLLRPADPEQRALLADSVAAMYPALLQRALPAHRTDWNDKETAFAHRFALHRQSEPAQPHRLVEETAALIHELVPIHQRLKRNDREVILGDLRLHTVAMYAAMQKRFRPQALVQALTGTPRT